MASADARLFADRGWFVGAFDVDGAGLASLQVEAPVGLTGRLDVTSEEQFRAAVDLFAEHGGGRMDMLFNNAGVIAAIGSARRCSR